MAEDNGNGTSGEGTGDDHISGALAQALAVNPEGLDQYRGQPVTAITIAIRNAGDGLSKAMEIAPEIFEMGDTVRVLLEGVVTHHDYEPIPKSNAVELKLVIKADTAMVVDDATSASKLRKMRDRIARHQEQKKGEQRLDGMSADDLEGADPDGGDEGARQDASD